MADIILNKTQEYVVNEAVKWFNYSSSELFEIDGMAGTGKSVVLNEIVKRIGLDEEEILPMAYTGQASIVMRMHGFKHACTCHSGLFNAVQEPLRDKDGKVILDWQFNTPIMKWAYEPKDISCFDGIKLIILDEAWMIPSSFKKRIDYLGIKTIAAGDQGQLPPVVGDPAYLTGNKVYHLTELMRQSEDSALVYLSLRARQGLPIDCGLYGNEVLVMLDNELNDEFLRRSDVILCGTNDTRDNLNNYIRHNIMHYYDSTPRFGERIICRKNNWSIETAGIPLVNGLTGVVATPPDPSEFDRSRGTFNLNFLPDKVNAYFPNIKANIKYIQSDLKVRRSMKKSVYTRGELFEYAYASTVHLSQGSEYFYGTYIQDIMNSDLTNALNYTAITRFKSGMVYAIHKPKYWQIPVYKDIINMKGD